MFLRNVGHYFHLHSGKWSSTFLQNNGKTLSYHRVSAHGSVNFIVSHCYGNLKSWPVPAVISLWEIILLEVSIRCTLASPLYLQSPFPSWYLGQDWYLGPVLCNSNIALKLLQQFSTAAWWPTTAGLETEMPIEMSMKNLTICISTYGLQTILTLIQSHSLWSPLWNSDVTEYDRYEFETLWKQPERISIIIISLEIPFSGKVWQCKANSFVYCCNMQVLSYITDLFCICFHGNEKHCCLHYLVTCLLMPYVINLHANLIHS